MMWWEYGLLYMLSVPVAAFIIAFVDHKLSPDTTARIDLGPLWIVSLLWPVFVATVIVMSTPELARRSATAHNRRRDRRAAQRKALKDAEAAAAHLKSNRQRKRKLQIK